MLFSHRLSLSSLIDLCRTLRHYLGAGLTMRDVFKQQSQKGSLAVRPVATRISEHLERGDDLESALENEKAVFPPLFVSLASVGEKSGNLPEIFGELEKYFRLQQKLWRQFYSQITWPVIQFCLAVLVIAGLLLILGMLPGGKSMDPFGIGVGEGAAVSFLAGVVGIIALVFGVYMLATRLLQQKALIDGLLLRLPAIGSCLHALALSRFCMALRLTTETGMSITKAMRLSLRATGNAAFSACTRITDRTLKAGEELAMALARCHVFGEEFVNILAVGEESGRISEVMEHQAEYYQEEAARKLKLLAQVAAWGVWLFVAILIIIAIFKIAGVYFGAIEDAGRGAF